jgi:hypothetical protein
MVNPKQQVSARGIRILGSFVVIYLLIGSYMHFYMSLPVIVYAGYGIFSWAAGMGLFYWLHKNYMSQLG